MNWKFWKHKKTKEVIKDERYNKLPKSERTNYVPTNEQSAATVAGSSDDSLYTTPFYSPPFNNTPSYDDWGGISDSGSSSSSSDSSSTDYSGYDGGSGGGGADNSW